MKEHYLQMTIDHASANMHYIEHINLLGNLAMHMQTGTIQNALAYY